MVTVHPCSRVCVASVCWVTLLVLSTGGFTQGAQHCFQCLEGAREPTQFCNTTSNLHQCANSARDICYTKVTNDDGKLISVKGCILARLCHQAATLNDQYCSEGTVLSRCTYCCRGDSCNHDQFEYSPSIPTTTIPPPTPTTPSLRSTLAPSTCKNENLTRCTKDYEEAMMVAMKVPRTNFPYFCRQVPVIFQCIAKAMSSCCPDNQLALHNQLKSVSDVMWSQCPRECDVIKGQACTMGIITKVISKLIDGSGDCETLRIIVIDYQQCLVINVGTCVDAVRLGFEDTAKVIKSAVEGTCTTPAPARSRRALPTDVPGCRPKTVEQCLVHLAENITEQAAPDYDIICRTVLSETEKCFEEHSATCPAPTKERLQHAFNFTRQLMTQQCAPPTKPPPICDTTAARTCALEIWRVFDDVGDKGQACSMVEETVQCVLSNATGCTDREKQSLNNTLDHVFKKLEAEGMCKVVAEMVGECTNVQLVEGGNEWQVRFHSNYDPKHLCGGEDDCKVYVQVVVAKTSSPKCQNGDAIPQIMCRPEPKPKSGPACGVLITSDNWKKTQTINLAATLDNKVDGNKKVEVKLQYIKVIKEEVVEVTTLETCLVTVIDHDKGGQCQSINDPHMSSFDGVRYNNFLEGVFVLYRHTSLPYEVQVLYQKCGRAATCNCGVAVKSGDSVFFVDKCKRKSKPCAGRNCKNLMTAKSYAGDEVTDGTRLFKRPAGFEVLLPHGTRVKIQKYHGLLNVWVTPSAADYMSTTGLCGVYDGSRDRDLVLPNGNPHTGHGVGPGRHPKAFCKTWRITDQRQWLHAGAPSKPYHPPQYCVCEDKACHKVDCSAKHLVATCDIKAAGEILFTTLPTNKPDVEITRQKRAMKDEADFVFDYDFEPKEIDPSTREWTEQKARTFCQDYMDGSTVIGLCKFQAQVDVVPYVNICIQDILLADDTKWAISALEGVKAECVNVLDSDPKFADSDTSKHIVAEIAKASCPLECLGRGTCDKGKCQCKDNYVGETCDVKADAVPSYISADNNGLCNTRKTDCSRIVVYADDLIKTDKLTCHLTEVEVTEAGVSNTTNSLKITAEYFSTNQVICRMRSSTLRRGYYIDLSNDGERVSRNPLLYVPHDPHCFDCKIRVDGTTCTRKRDTCVVDGKCYVSGETDPQDACSLCDPASSTSILRSDKSLACLGPHVMIIIPVVAILCVILLAVVTWYCCCRKRKNKTKEGVGNELTWRREY